MGGFAAGPAGGVHGLVRALTTFIGRTTELDELVGLLAEHPMVTVTGPGGVGKTRLAGEVARQAAARFADGAWVVELASVQDQALVPAAVAAGLALPQVSGVPVMESLVAALTRQQMLLVLDNCEHVLEGVAQLCGALLPFADEVRVLATSREPVRVPGEVRYRLRPLEVPAPGDLSGAAGSPAVVMFTDRARQNDPGFSLDGDSEPAVARLVARLDGMPLAIELAAARLEALGLTQLLERLEESFRLLTGGDRAAVPRQRSLAATVDWSYRLLDEDERRVFRRLAIFPGPFTLDAAAAVAGPASAVLHLVDCSLVIPPRTGPDGRVRYLMLQTLRAFGLERLEEEGEHQEAAAALAQYAVRVAERACGEMKTSTGEVAAARWLDAEDANLQQALPWTLAHDPAAALRLAIALSPWWSLRARSAAAYPLLGAAAGHAAAGSDSWCAAQYWLGQAIGSTGDMEAAFGHFSAAADVLAQAPPSPLRVLALCGRANMAMFLDRVLEGAEDARVALAMAREIGYPAGESNAQLCLAIAAYYVDDFPNAVRWARQACQIDPAIIPGYMAREANMFLTLTLAEVGEIIAAQQSCTDGLVLARDAGDLQAQTAGTVILADLDVRAGCPADGWAHLGAALTLAARIRDRHRLWDCLPVGARLCAGAGQWAETVTLWTAHQAFADDSGLTPTAPTVRRRQESMAKAAQALDPQRMRAAQERGAAMTLQTAVDFAGMLTEAQLNVPAAPDPLAGLSELSAREQELITLVAQGHTDRQIAESLYISVSTVRSHLDRIRDKTSCRRRADLTRLALRASLV